MKHATYALTAFVLAGALTACGSAEAPSELTGGKAVVA